jgi:hypothetical protein
MRIISGTFRGLQLADVGEGDASAHLRPTNATQQHVRDHLRDYVNITPRRIHTPMRQRPGTDIWPQPYYVDPRTGLLCRTARLTKRRP